VHKQFLEKLMVAGKKFLAPFAETRNQNPVSGSSLQFYYRLRKYEYLAPMWPANGVLSKLLLSADTQKYMV
jgi:hypothetical protein